MYWHPPTDTVYLAHPRTGSVATHRALEDQTKFRCVGSHHDSIERAMENRAHRGPKPEELDGLWVFSVVRNHFDTIVSWLYGGDRTANLPIDAQEVDRALEHAAPYCRPAQGVLFPHRLESEVVIRWEGLPEALNLVLEHRGIEMVSLPRENVSGGRDGLGYREAFAPEGRRRVEELFGDEMDELGYRWADPDWEGAEVYVADS